MSLEELRTTYARVEYLLDKYPATRNNDFYLHYLYLKFFEGLGHLPFLPWDKIKEIGGVAATTRRIRAKIQNDEGRYLPTDENVIRRRRQREADFRQNINRV